MSASELSSLTSKFEGAPLIKHLSSMLNLKMLDLSSNKLRSLIPKEMPLSSCSQFALKSLLSLNLSDNPLSDLKTTVNIISVLMPILTDLQISIFAEEDVNYIISKLQNLVYLNNLPVKTDVIQINDHTNI